MTWEPKRDNEGLYRPEYSAHRLQFEKIAVHCNWCQRDILICPETDWNAGRESPPWMAIRKAHDLSEEHQQNAILVRLS